MSSLMVMKNEWPYANGYWDRAAAGHFNVTITWGMSSSTSETVSTEMTDSLTKEMTSGISFKHASESTTLSETHQQSVMRSTTDTYSQTWQAEMDFSCPPTADNPDEENIGLW